MTKKSQSEVNGMQVTLWAPGWLMDNDFVEDGSMKEDLWEAAVEKFVSSLLFPFDSLNLYDLPVP